MSKTKNNTRLIGGWDCYVIIVITCTMISFWLHAHVVFALRFAMASDSEAAVFGRPSILDKLKAPKQSELNRKRKVHVNAPPKGKRRARGEGANEPKSISASQRVREFPNESLTVSHNKLFCAACREELSLRKGVISSHVSSAKHKNGKERLKLKEAKERDIAKALAVNDEKCHPVGETLPEEQRVSELGYSRPSYVLLSHLLNYIFFGRFWRRMHSVCQTGGT